MNPYRIAAGPELDAMIQSRVFGETANGSSPAYSRDDALALRVRDKLTKRFKTSIVTGQTRMRPPMTFARWETGPSTSTEVLAESLALAICRLAMIITEKYGD